MEEDKHLPIRCRRALPHAAAILHCCSSVTSTATHAHAHAHALMHTHTYTCTRTHLHSVFQVSVDIEDHRTSTSPASLRDPRRLSWGTWDSTTCHRPSAEPRCSGCLHHPIAALLLPAVAGAAARVASGFPALDAPTASDAHCLASAAAACASAASCPACCSAAPATSTAVLAASIASFAFVAWAPALIAALLAFSAAKSGG